MKSKFVTLTCVLTVRRDEAESAKECLMEALAGDFDCIYGTSERPATEDEVKQYNESFGE